MQNVFLAPFFGQKIFINNLILIGSNPVIVLLLYISSPSCWPSRHHQHFFSCGLKHLLLASRLPCIQRLQLKWLMSQLAASLPLPTNYLTPWTFSLRSLELLLLLPLLPPPVPALVGNSWIFAPKMKSCFPNGHSWSHLVWQSVVECKRQLFFLQLRTATPFWLEKSGMHASLDIS